MTGTPLDLTPFGPLLKSAGYVYWLIALGLTAFALWVPGRWWVKVPIAALILGGFAYPVITHKDVKQQQVDAAKTKLDAAMAHFEMRCKSAGEKISRTVENVEGVAWMKWREGQTNFGDQFKLDDPYGRWCGSEDCISGLLIDYRMVPSGTGLFPSNKPVYQYVESLDPTDGRLYRYRKSSSQSPLSKEAIPSTAATYGITWDDVSTHEDREHWIAGGAIKVIDLKANEVIAERIGYVMDLGQGSAAGFRSPWTWARSNGPACPPIAQHNLTFVTKVLKPRQSEN